MGIHYGAYRRHQSDCLLTAAKRGKACQWDDDKVMLAVRAKDKQHGAAIGRQLQSQPIIGRFGVSPAYPVSCCIPVYDAYAGVLADEAGHLSLKTAGVYSRVYSYGNHIWNSESSPRHSGGRMEFSCAPLRQ